MVEAKEKR